MIFKATLNYSKKQNTISSPKCKPNDHVLSKIVNSSQLSNKLQPIRKNRRKKKNIKIKVKKGKI